MSQLMFGGDWTEQKLSILEAYLQKYTTIMDKQPFKSVYIDAFAGTGYRNLRHAENPNMPLLPEFLEEEPVKFLDGSARKALNVKPQFDYYTFIESDGARFTELQKLKDEFSSQKEKMTFVNADANQYLADLCSDTSYWRSKRAVLFLDPFGMQVRWDTVKAIASTRAIDMWYLFPLSTVNRLLTRDGRQMRDEWRSLLNQTFGEPAWYERFYVTHSGLFGEEDFIVKSVNFNVISAYIVERLKTVFPGVAENPAILWTSKSPLFLLCFAAANEKGAPIALRIAEHLLKHI